MVVKVASGIAVVSIALLLFGCAGTLPAPHVSDVSGTWSSGDVRLILNDDMSARLADVPASIFGVEGSSSLSTDDATWTIGNSGEKYGADGMPLIGVMVDIGGTSTGAPFAVSHEGGATVLYAYLGDPDSDGRLVLRRER